MLLLPSFVSVDDFKGTVVCDRIELLVVLLLDFIQVSCILDKALDVSVTLECW